MTTRGGQVRPKVVALVAAGGSILFLSAALSAQVPEGALVPWWQPWLSPGVIVGAAGLILRSNEANRKKVETAFAALGAKVDGLSGRIASVEQELLGYDRQGGALATLRHIEQTIDTDVRQRNDLALRLAGAMGQIGQLGMWAVEAGAKMGVPMDRRSLTRREES